MRVYFITKRKMLRVLLMLFLISSAVVLALPYKEAVVNVFNANHEIPIYSVETPQKRVAITFDCAWGGQDIPQLINILKKYNVKATFFPVGSWIDKYPENIKALDKAGHEIANHSDTHADLTSVSQDRVKSEIEACNKKIQNLTGKQNNIFRAPYGAYNDRVVSTAKSMGQYVIQWDVDSLDWKELGVEPMVRRVTEKTKNGSILLFHNDTKYTLEALPTILERLKAQGYEFVTVSQLIMKENYYIDNQGRQHSLIKEKASID